MVRESVGDEEERKYSTAARSWTRPTRGGVEEERVVEHRRRERRVVKMEGVGRDADGGVDGVEMVEKASSEATEKREGRKEEEEGKEEHTISFDRFFFFFPLLPSKADTER